MAKKLKSTHEGTLKIGTIDLPVAVLENGTRLISYTSIFKAFGKTKRGAQKGRVPNMPAFLNSQNVQPFVSEELKVVLNPVDYITTKGKEAKGYKAEILPLLCDTYLEANNARNENGKPVLLPSQLPMAKSAEILVRGLSRVGIIALIDEATGYQYDRDRQELHKILEAYINKSLLPWTKKFPDEFYQEMFRLKGWPYNPAKVKKPQVVGHYTNMLIYEQLPPGILKELKEKTPKNASGNNKHKFHQLLTPDIGHTHLSNQLSAVVALMKVSPNWRKFKANFATAFNIGQTEIEFDDDEK